MFDWTNLLKKFNPKLETLYLAICFLCVSIWISSFRDCLILLQLFLLAHRWILLCSCGCCSICVLSNYDVGLESYRCYSPPSAIEHGPLYQAAPGSHKVSRLSILSHLIKELFCGFSRKGVGSACFTNYNCCSVLNKVYSVTARNPPVDHKKSGRYFSTVD